MKHISYTLAACCHTCKHRVYVYLDDTEADAAEGCNAKGECPNVTVEQYQTYARGEAAFDWFLKGNVCSPVAVCDLWEKRQDITVPCKDVTHD